MILFFGCVLFDPTLDSLDKSMTTVLHPMHSHVPLHTQMILGNFPRSPPSVPLVHNNLEMQIDT
jgi:hypothetical protein